MEKNPYSPPKSKVTDLSKKTVLNLPASLLLGFLASFIALIISSLVIIFTIVPDIFSINDAIITARLVAHPHRTVLSIVFFTSIAFPGPWITTKLSGKNWKSIGLFYALFFLALALINSYIQHSTINFNLRIIYSMVVIILSSFLGAYLGRWKNANLS